MQKDTLVKILVVLAVLFFMTELFTVNTFSNIFAPQNSGGQNVSSTATFNATLRSYSPILIIQKPPNATSLLSRLQSMEQVKKAYIQNGMIVINLDIRDDVLPLAQILQKESLNPIGQANLDLPPQIQSVSGYQTLNISASGIIVTVDIAPYFQPGSTIPVSMSLISNNNYLVGGSAPQVLYSQKNLSIVGNVSAILSSTKIYSIPWENRTILNGVNSGNASRSDLILFATPLSPSNTTTKRNLSYIVYLDSHAGEVSQNMTDRSRILSDFAPTIVNFPQSTLEVSPLNETDPLPFNYTLQYVYLVNLPQSSSGLTISGGNPIEVSSSQKLSENASTTLTVQLVVIGDSAIAFGASQ